MWANSSSTGCMTYLAILTESISGVIGIYDYNLVRTNSYNLIPTTRDWGLLDLNGGTVYYSYVHNKGTTLNWMCLMLGYQSYNSYTYSYSYEWQQNYPIRYYQLDCTGSVVPQCRYQKANNYNYYYSLWLQCNPRSRLGDTSGFYLVDKDNRDTQRGYGLLKYRSGTVSGNKFDDTTAELICRIMGYDKFLDWSVGRKYQFQEGLSIGMKDLNCLKSEEVFPMCIYGTNTAGETHENDIWLWCARPRHSYYELVCPPGQRRSSSTQCSQCPANQYSSEPSQSSSCTSCPTYSTSLAGSTQCSCASGRYMSLNNVCLPCPTNSTSIEGSTSCTCDGGTYLHSNYGSCVACPSSKVSRRASRSSSDCVSCPTGSEPIDDRKSCSCGVGKGWEWSSNIMETGFCVPCPANFYKDQRKGSCVQCPDDATSLPLSEDCQCPENLTWDGSSCVNCSAEDVSSGPCACSGGTFWNKESDECDVCPENHYSGNYSTSCSKCPINTLSVNGSSVCSECPKGHSWVNYACAKCPLDQVGDGKLCSKCPGGSVPINDGQACSCDQGHGWKWNISEEVGSCETCPENSYKDREQGTCIVCPSNATSFSTLGGCHCPNDLSWNGKTCVNCSMADSNSSCACMAGTFWNSNTSRCEPCQENYYSGNFSSVCLKCPMYKVSDQQASECIQCPKGYSWQNYSCIACPTNLTGNGVVCKPCPESSEPLKDGKICSCKKGSIWQWSTGINATGSCEMCQLNTFKDVENNVCMPCPYEQSSLPLYGDCHCPNGLSWDGKGCSDCSTSGNKSGVCNCVAGTYWNTASEQCEPCSENQFSGNNSFWCLKCPIFTVSDMQSAECVSCPKGHSWYNYTCTECPENHVSLGATCTICPKGTSPSIDKTVCQMPVVDIFPLVNSVLILAIIIGNIICMCKYRKKRESLHAADLKVTYRAEPCTSKS